MQVVILTGGLGTRLKPITEKIPKVMVEVAGKPFLEHQLGLFKKWGFRDFLLLSCYLKEQVQEYFGSGKKWGVLIDYSCESTPLGTGGALKLASPKLKDRFLLVNGDTFFPIPFDDFIQEAKSLKEGGIIAIYDNHDKVAKNNVRVERDCFLSKYSNHEEENMNGVDGGVSLYCKSVLDYIPEKRKVSLEEEVYPLLIQKRLLRAYFTTVCYYDMGTFERLKEANKKLSDND